MRFPPLFPSLCFVPRRSFIPLSYFCKPSFFVPFSVCFEFYPHPLLSHSSFSFRCRIRRSFLPFKIFSIFVFPVAFGEPDFLRYPFLVCLGIDETMVPDPPIAFVLPSFFTVLMEVFSVYCVQVDSPLPFFLLCNLVSWPSYPHPLPHEDFTLF